MFKCGGVQKVTAATGTRQVGKDDCDERHYIIPLKTLRRRLGLPLFLCVACHLLEYHISSHLFCKHSLSACLVEWSSPLRRMSVALKRPSLGRLTCCAPLPRLVVSSLVTTRVTSTVSWVPETLSVKSRAPAQPRSAHLEPRSLSRSSRPVPSSVPSSPVMWRT